MKKIVLILFAAMMLCALSCSEGDKEKTIYTITFDTGGGSPVPQAQKIEEGETASAPSVNPIRDGYSFLFWHLEGSVNAYNFQTPVNANLVLYARWQDEATAEYWQVSWDLNGGSWPASGDNHVDRVLKGGTLAEPSAPVKADHTLEGWYKETALTNKVYFPYDVSSATADIALYAKWKSSGGEEPGNTFTSIAALKTWLASQEPTTVDNAYKVGLKDVNLDNGTNWADLGEAVSAVKYVELDLTGCTGTAIPDGEAVSSSGKITYYGVFVNCDELVSIKLPPGLQSVGKYAFYQCSELISVVLPGTVEDVRDYAFRMCEKLTSINFPSSINSIGRYAFFGCSFESAVIPEGVTVLNDSSFGYNYNLSSITLPSTLQTIERWVFSDNRKLKTITIPENVQSIGESAFELCGLLEEVLMKSVSPPALGANAFRSTNESLNIKVPAGGVEAYKAADGWKAYSGKIVANAK